VWRGGASIFAAGVFTAWNDSNRQVHLCDSFAGLPENSTAKDTPLWKAQSYLEVSLDAVKNHFARFHLLQEKRVKFHRGYFQFSLPIVRQEFLRSGRKLAVLRLDGDMWESTMDELFNLYDLLSVNGIVIIDDWHFIRECREAIVEFMTMHNLQEQIVVDRDVAYWKKEREVTVDYTWYVNWNHTRAIVPNVKP